MLKLCNRCGKYKALYEFYKLKNGEFGLQIICKTCSKQYGKDNRDRIRIKEKEYRAKYYLDNKKAFNKRRKLHYKNNKNKYTGYNAKYRTKKLEQIIELNDQEQALYNKYYSVCNFLNTDGIKYHVDHITPVSKGGTNHPSNLQILTVEDNLSKSNNLYYEYKHPVIKL